MKYRTFVMENVLDSIIDYRGKTPKKSENGIKTLSAKSVRDGYIDYSQCYYISKEEYDRFMVRGFPKVGDVLMTTEAPLGVLARLDRDDIALAQRLITLRGKENVLDTGYLYYYLRSPVGQGKIKERQTGTTVTGIKQAEFRKIEIALPSIDIQRKVASLLGVLDEKILVNKKINDNLLQQAFSILSSFFIDFSHFDGSVPDDWEQGTLGDIIDFSNGYAFKSKELLDAPLPDCYKVFKQGHINRGGGFNSSGTKSWYPVSKCSKLSKYVLRKGDVLMAMTDMKDNVAILGNTALMAVDNQYIVNQRVGLLRSNGYKSTSFAYIYLLTNSFDFLKNLRRRANSGVQVNLSSFEIKNSPLWIAPDSVNNEFNALTEPLLSMIMANDIENQKLAELRDTLLPKLISGELDVSNISL